MEKELFFSPQTNLSRSSFSDDQINNLDEFPGFLDYDDSLGSLAQAFYGQIEPESSIMIPMDGAPKEESDGWEVQGDGGDSSGTRPRRDRSRTLLTERKRRGRMKEELYELRSLVPNITKMDKASIIADAAVYVRDMQREARKLEEEIAALELTSPREGQELGLELPDTREATVGLNVGRILRLTVHGAGEGKFYVRITGVERVPGSLYRAIGTLDCFHLESSNFSMDQEERCVLAFVLNGSRCGEGMNNSAVRFLVAEALLNQGFQFHRMTDPSIN